MQMHRYIVSWLGQGKGHSYIWSGQDCSVVNQLRILAIHGAKPLKIRPPWYVFFLLFYDEGGFPQGGTPHVNRQGGGLGVFARGYYFKLEVFLGVIQMPSIF